MLRIFLIPASMFRHGSRIVFRSSYLRRMLWPTLVAASVALAACVSKAPDPRLAREAGRAADRVADSYVLIPDRLFDGRNMREGHGVAVSGGRIVAVGPVDALPAEGRLPLPGATLLPGFIDLHGHLAAQDVSFSTVLRHGITSVRDLGGPPKPVSGGDGSLRHLSAGPIITAPGGYPIPVFGQGKSGGGHGHGAAALAVEVADAAQARRVVDHIVEAGASVIKIALEPGGSAGAPWSMHEAGTPPPWPLPSAEVVKTVVAQAHARGRIVSAHLSGVAGVRLALDAGVDEWAHMPCDALPEALIARAVEARVRIVGTLDTLSHCGGAFANAQRFVEKGGTLLYGTDMAHTELPWGIDSRELELMMHVGHGQLSAEKVLSAATALAGEQAGLAPLGQLAPGAPADMIAVRGNPLHRLKVLEYPGLVISGGKFVVRDLIEQER